MFYHRSKEHFGFFFRESNKTFANHTPTNLKVITIFDKVFGRAPQ